MILRVLAAAAAFVLAATQPASAQPGPLGTPTSPYTADSRMTAGGQQIDAKIAVAGTNERRELTMRGQRSITLIDHKTQKAVMLMPAQKMAMDVAMSQAAGPTSPGDMKWTTQAVGPERVGNVDATKYKVEGSNAQGSKTSGHVWATAERIMVKSEFDITDKGRTTKVSQVLSNLKIGPIDPTLFQVPPDYRRMQIQNMQQMMQGMPPR